MPNFDDAVMSFGEEEENKNRIFKHPVALFFHLCFRVLAFVVYLFARSLTSSYIISFLLILFFLSMDFWTVKNISGRLLVGLRWWNFVDEAGESHWKFESRKVRQCLFIDARAIPKQLQDDSRTSSTEARIFWVSLVITPTLWFLFAFMNLFSASWLVLNIIGVAMTGANLWGYVRCKWSSRAEISSYISQTMFRSLLTRATQQATNQAPVQTA